MRTHKVEDFLPIHLMAGDMLNVTYEDETLVSHAFTENNVVDRVAIVELDAAEAAPLGMSSAFGGIIGRRG